MKDETPYRPKGEEALEALLALQYNTTDPLKERIQKGLALGNHYFDTLYAIVSAIKDDHYTVMYCVAPAATIMPGQVFPLGQTYCVHTLRADGPIGFHHAGQSAIRDHPCYQNFKLESYFGIPLRIRGERYGTVNFSAPYPRHTEFDAYDEAFLATFADWVGKRLG